MWITILALCDENGLVRATTPGLSTLARIPIPRAKEIIAMLEAPDEFSRSLENEGRRIARIDGGYLVLNYTKYREKISHDIVRNQTKIRVANWKKRNSGNAPVTQINAKQRQKQIQKQKQKKISQSLLVADNKDHSGEYTETDPPPPLPNPPGLRASRKNAKPTSVGEIVKTLIKPPKAPNVDRVAARIVAATNDQGFSKPGWLRILTEISTDKDACKQLIVMLDRIEKDSDPRLAAGRDHDWIKSPGRFASSELKRIQKLVRSSE
jgi:hypothetical protein